MKVLFIYYFVCCSLIVSANDIRPTNSLSMLSTASDTSDLNPKREYNYLKTNTLFFELGGVGWVYSINFEKRIPFKYDVKNWGLALSTGIAPYPEEIIEDDDISLVVPFRSTLVYQTFRNRFDIGLGFSYAIITDKDPDIYLSTILMYTKSFLMKDKFEFGVFLSPVVLGSELNHVVPWGGFRFGYKFNQRRKVL